jgi:predicted RNase H-like HicB family nuclease
MHNEFTAVFERDGDWVIAYSPEIPGANGQGRTKDEAGENLAQAIALILEDRRAEISNSLARKICRGLGVPEIGK